MNSSGHIMNDLEHLITKINKCITNQINDVYSTIIKVVYMCITMWNIIILFIDVHTVLGMV